MTTINNNTTTNIGIGAFKPQTRPGRHLVDLTNIPAEDREEYANQVIHDLVEQHKLDRPVWFTVITEDANGKKQYKVPAGFEFERTGLPVPGFRDINPFDLKKRPLDDFGLAQLFYDVVLQGKILYNQESGVTYYYDGTKWVPDDQASTHFMACLRAFKNLLSDAMQYIDNEKFRESFKKSRYNRAISEGGGRVLLKLVKTLCGVKQSDFDADPYKINLLNGVYDFRLQSFQPGHRPEDMMTCVAGVEYDPEARCPRFEQFLDEVFEGDKSKIGFLLRWLSYSMTGCTHEENFVMCWGPKSRNGKGTLATIMRAILGDYGTESNQNLIRKGHNSGGNNELLAMLVGKRSVSIPEIENGMEVDTSLVKSITGEDVINVARKYEHAVSIRMCAKLTIYQNTRPRMRDHTIFASNRILILVFPHHFAENEQDKHLKQQLTQPEALSGILNMLLAGYSDYLAHGLAIPDVVRQDTADYQLIDDDLGGFISETLIKTGNKDDVVTSGEAYAIYREWCDEVGMSPLSRNNFLSRMDDRGMWSRHATRGRRCLIGYTIKQDDDFPYPDPEFSNQDNTISYTQATIVGMDHAS